MPVGCLSGESTIPKNRNGAPGSPPPASSNGSSGMEVVVTSSVLNAADQFAFMQQTLLLQIFRLGPDHHHPGSGAGSGGNRLGSNSPNSLSSGASGGSGSTGSGPGGACASSGGNQVLECPTCAAFSDHCCQNENGFLMFHDFKLANSNCSSWDQRMAEAISSLRYQGYICPGILVLLASANNLEVVADAWRRRVLTPPANCKISQVGLSNGCVVKPVLQSHQVALPDIICVILARMKHRQQIADMDSICDAIRMDWSSGLVSRMLAASPNSTNGSTGGDSLKAMVHSALGTLIKQRKVYYTGNKGYFLVVQASSNGGTSNGSGPVMRGVAENGGSLGGALGSQLRHSLRRREARSSKSRSMIDQEAQTDRERDPTSGMASPRSPLSPVWNVQNHGPDGRRDTVVRSPTDSENPYYDGSDFVVTVGALGGQHSSSSGATSPVYSVPKDLVQSPSNRSGHTHQHHHPQPQGTTPGRLDAVDATSPSPRQPGHSPTLPLERSQSLRLSRKSIRSLSSRGGSLRLSKKEVNQLKAADEDDERDPSPSNPSLQSPPPPPPPPTDTSKHNGKASSKSSGATPSKFERKNSFLSKFFGNSGSAMKKSKSFNGGGGSGSGKTSSTGRALSPHATTTPNKRDTPQRPVVIKTFSAQFPPPELLELSNPIYTALIKKPTTQQPSVSVPSSSPVLPPQPTRPAPSPGAIITSSKSPSPQVVNSQGQYVIYERMGERTHPPPVSYGYSQIRFPPSSGGGHPGAGGNSGSGSDASGPTQLYSNPPPPLPYRPPPPNPYLLQPPPPPPSHFNQRHLAGSPSVNSRSSPSTSLVTSSAANKPSNFKGSSPNKIRSPCRGGRNVRFADESTGTSGNGSSSGPSSIESVVVAGGNTTTKPLFDNSLVVIERSNTELELNLNNTVDSQSSTAAAAATAAASGDLKQSERAVVHRILAQGPARNSLVPPVDTIHNNARMNQEIIYEVASTIAKASSATNNPKVKNSNNQSGVRRVKSGSMSHHPPPSLKSQMQAVAEEGEAGAAGSQPSVAPSYPSISDLSTVNHDADVNFKSLTAQKLMAGLSFNSIDTLLEVNAAAEARTKLNESTETIPTHSVDFGVI